MTIVEGDKRAQVAFASTDPRVLEAWQSWKNATLAHRERIQQWRRDIDPDEVFDLLVYGRHRIAYLLPKKRPVKIAERPQPPEGFRYMANGQVKPDRRTKAGRAQGKLIDELNNAKPPRLQVPGMPGDIWVPNGDGSFYIHECGMFVHEGKAYAHWEVFPKGYDDVMWTELKLSEFYAAEEAWKEVRPV